MTNNKVWLITGASSRIGLEITKAALAPMNIIFKAIGKCRRLYRNTGQKIAR